MNSTEILSKRLPKDIQRLRTTISEGERALGSPDWSSIKATVSNLEEQLTELQKQAKRLNDPLARMARGESLSPEAQERLMIDGRS